MTNMPYELRDKMFLEWLDDGVNNEDKEIVKVQMAFNAGWKARKEAVDYGTNQPFFNEECRNYSAKMKK